MALRVLIVEDEPHIIESLAFVLGREGYDVASVMDGEAALDMLRRAPPDLVILDVMIPRLNGFEVLKAAKSDPAMRRIPIVVLTAKGQVHDRRLAQEIGSDGFMTKPFSNREIVDQVRRLIGA